MSFSPIIGFINPPSNFLTDQRVFISLGILRVATNLNRKYNIEFLDLSGRDNLFDLIDDFINTYKINIICITSTTPQIKDVYEIGLYIKEKYNIKLVIGGPHITLM